MSDKVFCDDDCLQTFNRLEAAICTDVGKVRQRNEDVVFVDPKLGLAVLADGMGGYRGGDVAAALAVKQVVEFFADAMIAERGPEALARLALDVTRDVNRAIHRAGELEPELAGMGCTLVAALFLEGEVVSAHVGDSRLYRYDGQRLVQLTRDHTMLQEQVDLGIIGEHEARRYAYRGLLTRGLGVADDVVPDLGFHQASLGDTFLLCSDGLTDMLDDERIVTILAKDAAVGLIATELVDEANAQGGRDNVSVVVVRVLQ